MVIQIPYVPRHWAESFHASFARWSCLVLHRRAGKTTAYLNHHQRAATDDAWETRRLRHLSPGLSDEDVKRLLQRRNYAHILPTYKQAKLVAWDLLKFYAPGPPWSRANETELSIRYANGSTVRLFGADKPDSLRGIALSGVSFDEYAMMPPRVFSEVISKALADHLGYAGFIGTVKGKNQLYRTYKAFEKDPTCFALWQDVNQSLETEDDAATLLLRQAMHDDRELIKKGGLMTQEEYDQEWFLSTDASILGAFYAAQMAAARKEGRITRVPYDPALPVNTYWDLGMDDNMAIIFAQRSPSGQVRVIDFEHGVESPGEDAGKLEVAESGLPGAVRVLASKPYAYGRHYAPHDIMVREMGTSKSRLEIARGLGLKFEVVRSIPVTDGIAATRAMLSRCWFDAERCDHLLEALRHYRKRRNEQTGEWTGEPVHNWASHPADAARMMAVADTDPKDEKKRPGHIEEAFDPRAEQLGWMN